MTESSLRTSLYVIIFGTHTRAGKLFDLCLIATILSSLLVFILESIPEVNAQWHEQLRYFEYGFTFLFTVEYIIRLYCSPRPAAYAKSFYGIIDLLAILPTYLALIFPSVSFMAVVRLIRVMRIFRILKLVRYLQDSNILMRSLLMARRKIFIFFSTVSILITIFGVLIYIIEGPEHGFSSIPKSIYWAIVTITTVGYGDLVPQTPLGQSLASLTMLLGYSILAVPTGILTAELSKEMNIHRQLVKCPNCSQTGHDSDALFCKHCGSQLADPDKRVVPVNPPAS
ncbi:ion transporter [Vibrio mangrovi]|uniref:Cyclic nucleotide-gated potassium channel n=1 Tax=Vibrio mangrovi TaxID=474394 RepID=A0A1Y6ISN1_9VIBR|nr:ion transporter [Vibrio mangrovi]MDW6001342.1 ion transporter [Vibrio mangrovi]SMS00636.1 Cyclic nucleotide-gated potassium channel [Vibrio mangrovi]